MSTTVKISLNLDNFNRGMNEFNSQMKKATADTTRFGNEMVGIGKGLTAGVTVPLLAIGTASVTTGAQVEKTMSKVQAVTNACEVDMAKLTETSRHLGRTTVFSTKEASEGMEKLGMAGFEVNEIIEAMPGMLNLAAAGSIEVGAAADIASNILSGFGMEAAEVGRVADVMAKACAGANTDMHQLGDAMKYLAPVANQLGWDIEGSTTAVMTLSNAGLQGSNATSVLRTSLQRLANPTKEATALMKETGIAFFDAEGNAKPLYEMVGQLEKGLEGMSDQQRTAALSTLFGAQASGHWAILLEEGSEALREQTEELRNADGTAQEMASTIKDNLIGDLNGLKSSIEYVSLMLADVLIPIMRDVVQTITRWVDELADRLTPELMELIVKLALVAATVGPVLIIIGKLIIAFGKVKAAVALLANVKFALLIAKLGLVVVAVVAVIAIFVLFGDEIRRVWDDYLQPVFEALVNWVQETIVPAFEAGFEEAKRAVGVAFEFIQEVWHNVLLPVFEAIIEGVKEHLLPAFEVGFAVMTDVVSGAWDLIKTLWETVLKPVWEMISDVILNVLLPNFDTVFAKIGVIVGTAFNLIGTLWSGVLKPILDAIIAFISNVLVPIWTIQFNVIAGVVSTIFQEIGTIWNNVLKPILSGIIDFVTGVFTGNWSMAWNGVSDIIGGVFNGMIQLVKTPLNIIIGLVNGFIRGLNKIAIPDWIPGIGGAGVNIPEIPKLARGGKSVRNGSFISGEAGAELVEMTAHGARVTPLSGAERSGGISARLGGNDGESKQPAIINVHLGGKQIVCEIVDDITKEQNRKKNQRRQFDGRLGLT